MRFAIFQAFVSEYAVTGKDAGTGSLLAALAEAGFLIGLEKNRFVIVVPALFKIFVNVKTSAWRSESLDASPSLFLLEREVNKLIKNTFQTVSSKNSQITTFQTVSSKNSQITIHDSSGSNLMPWTGYPFCFSILIMKIPILEAFISPLQRYCRDGKLCTTFCECQW